MSESDLQSTETDLSMEPRVYLSDVLDVTQLQRGRANLIVAPCHSGKTTAALGKIASLAECRGRVVMLIDTTAGKQALARQDGVERYSDWWLHELMYPEWEEIYDRKNVVVMSYHELGYKLQQTPNCLDNVEIIICDEMHNLIKYKGIERAQNIENKTIGTEEEVKVCEVTLDELARRANQKDGPLVVIMTATINAVSVTLEKMGVNAECFDYTDKITQDKTEHRIYYGNLEDAISKLEFGEKAIVYCMRITQMEKVAEMLDDGWRNICCLWGMHNTNHIMTDYQLSVREHILKTRQIPDDIDILVINAAYETSINIDSEDFKTVIVHNGNVDVQTQVRGRIRHDIDKLYLYDSKHEYITQYFPEEYYDRILTKKETDEIVQIMNLKNEKGELMKWPTLARKLEHDGAVVNKEKVNNRCIYVVHRTA